MKRTMVSAAVQPGVFVLSAVNAQDCDRQCLIDLADDYIAAMVAHDPGSVPLAPDVVIVENVERIESGEPSAAEPAAGDSRVVRGSIAQA